jgi:hypothetical protein
LGKEAFSPQRHKTNGIKILRMQAPDTHLSALSYRNLLKERLGHPVDLRVRCRVSVLHMFFCRFEEFPKSPVLLPLVQV